MPAYSNNAWEYEENFNIDLRDCKLLGEGHNGIVYLIPGNKVIKIFKDRVICLKEYHMLMKTQGSPNFPTVYAWGDNYIIKDYVDGQSILNYIKKNGLSRRMAIKLIELLEEFIRLNFTRIDIRCRDIYIRTDGVLVVIDPKSAFSRTVTYPRHLAKGLKKLGVLNIFLETLKKEKPALYKDWAEKIKKRMENCVLKAGIP
jgi:predicted Ser/Thr protein kinase